jgi:hypothetical protein
VLFAFPQWKSHQLLLFLLQKFIYKIFFCKTSVFCRENLDPQSQYTDAELWKSLELAQLKDVVSNLPGCLGMLPTRPESQF